MIRFTAKQWRILRDFKRGIEIRDLSIKWGIELLDIEHLIRQALKRQEGEDE